MSVATKAELSEDGRFVTVTVLSGKVQHGRHCCHVAGDQFTVPRHEGQCYLDANVEIETEYDPCPKPVEASAEALCEVCALVDGEPMWVTPLIIVNGDTGVSTTTYLDALGNVITGVVEAAGPDDCVACPVEEEDPTEG